MVKDASQYSKACKEVKYNPKTTVITKLILAWEKLFSIIAWWAHVTVTPDANKIIVLSKGT